MWIKRRITEERFLNLRWTTGLAGAVSPGPRRVGYLSQTRTVPGCASWGQLAVPALAGCRERPSLKAQLHVSPRVTAPPGSEPAAQARASCPALGSAAPAALSAAPQALPKQVCRLHESRVSRGWSSSGAPGAPAAAEWQWHPCQVYGRY